MPPADLAHEMEKMGGLLPSPTTLRPTPPRLRFVWRRLLRCLVPSFLSRSEGPDRDAVRPTDFLDGLRGYAAFIVFFYHFVVPAHPKAHIGYGGGNGVTDRWVTQLPIFRLIISGQECVFLFFIISGFSISLKPLTLARRGAFPELFDCLVSATFRRACRLYVPCLAILGFTLLVACMGGLRHAYEMTKSWPFPGKPLYLPVAYDSSIDQVKDFVRCIWDWADPLTAATLVGVMPYGTQLWTIPVELRCSLITYLAMLGLARVRTRIRISTMAAMAIYFHLRRHPEAPLFLIGTILAELHLVRQDSSSGPIQESRWEKTRNIAIFLFGLALASYPRHGGDKAFFFSDFYPIAEYFVGGQGKAAQYLITSIASTIIVYVVSISPTLQSLFTTRLARYLGKISFSLYCVHQLLINVFGYRSILFWWSITGKHTVTQYETGMAIAFVIQTIITVWAADVFWRLVDAPSVKWTRWLEMGCTVER